MVIRGLIRTIRPHQWVKNLFVMAPMFFARDVFTKTVKGASALNLDIVGPAVLATIVFCFLAGAVYTLNDLVDVEGDRVHPQKKHRPIASGEVPIPVARIFVVGLVLGSLLAAYLIQPWFAVVALAYFVENVFYSFKLKKVPFLDVGLISLGFVLRVMAGGIATRTPVSWYMYACTALLSLFLGFGKRRHEIAGDNADKQRAVLKLYSARSLTFALGLTGLLTFGTYLAYTLDEGIRAMFQSDWLWLTAPFTAFGLLRFLYLVTGRGGKGLRSESPTQEMLRDVPFVLNLVAWVVVVVAIVYRLQPA